MTVRHEQPALAMTVYRSFDELDNLQAAWDLLFESEGGLVYQSYDWCKLWWHFYGHGRELRILIFRAESELVAVIPFFIDTIGVWPIGLRVVKGIASEYSTSRFSMAIRPAFQHSVLQMSVKQLIEVDRCDLISIGPVVGAEKLRADLDQIATNQHVDVSIRPSNAALVMIYDLSGGLDKLMSNISSGRRANLRRSMRQIENQQDVVVRRIVDPEELKAEFDGFCELHRLRWREDGKRGHFEDWPDSKQFHIALLAAQGKHQRCRLYKISRQDEVLAYEYGYLFGDWYFWLLPARSVSQEWERLSIGQVSSLIQMRTEAENGAKRADLGMGFYEYKKSMGAFTEDLHQIEIGRRQWLSEMRVRLWFKISKLVHLLYYKIWFRRIAPRLNYFSSPLWSFWIRTRF